MDFYEKLQVAAKENNKQIFIPSAAIAGLDRIAAGVLKNLTTSVVVGI